MNDQLKDRLTRLADNASPDIPNVPALVRRGRRRRIIVRTGQGLSALALAMAVTLPLFLLLPLRGGSPGSTRPITSHLVVDFGEAHQAASGAHGGVHVSYAGMGITPPGNYLEGVFPSFSHMMVPPETPITFVGDSHGGSVSFAPITTDVVGEPTRATPTAPGTYRMTISTGWVSATARTTIIKPSFSLSLTIGAVPLPPSPVRVQLAPAPFGPVGSHSIVLAFGGREVGPVAVSTAPVSVAALLGPPLTGTAAIAHTLSVPVGTRFTIYGGEITGGQLRAWTDGAHAPPSVGARFDPAHGWLALAPGRYGLSMGVQSPGNPPTWVTFMLQVVQGSPGTATPSPVAFPALHYAATIRGPRPSGDPDSGTPLLQKGAGLVCAHLDVHQVTMGFRDVTSQGAVEVVRCDGYPAKYVKIVFTGVSVPSLVDESLATATKRLQMIGLRLGTVTYRSPGVTTGGAVLEQSPAVSDTVPAGTAVDLVMS